MSVCSKASFFNFSFFNVFFPPFLRDAIELLKRSPGSSQYRRSILRRSNRAKKNRKVNTKTRTSVSKAILHKRNYLYKRMVVFGIINNNVRVLVSVPCVVPSKRTILAVVGNPYLYRNINKFRHLKESEIFSVRIYSRIILEFGLLGGRRKNLSDFRPQNWNELYQLEPKKRQRQLFFCISVQSVEIAALFFLC